jgi:hypothetical protein
MSAIADSPNQVLLIVDAIQTSTAGVRRAACFEALESSFPRLASKGLFRPASSWLKEQRRGSEPVRKSTGALRPLSASSLRCTLNPRRHE